MIDGFDPMGVQGGAKPPAQAINDPDVAAKELLSFIERIERLEEENKAINDDKSDVYGEMRGRGYDVKAVKRVIRDRKRDPEELFQEEAVYLTYKRALGMVD